MILAARNFECSFQLADHVQVKGASLENGLLHLDRVLGKLLEVLPTKVAA